MEGSGKLTGSPGLISTGQGVQIFTFANDTAESIQHSYVKLMHLWLNAVLGSSVSIDETTKFVYQGGLSIDGAVFLSRANYGDGVFETMRSQLGRIPLLDLHLQRMARGLAVLGLAELDSDRIRAELDQIASMHPEAVIKLIAISAAPGGSYQRRHNGVEHAVVVSALPPSDALASPNGIIVRVCKTQLAQHSALSGIKHLGRGEQILGANEPNTHSAHEGLMLDTAAQVICAISGNIFVVLNGQLCTPIIDGAGVNGVMRARIMQICTEIGVELLLRKLSLDDICRASELFLCNAVRAVRPVARLIDQNGAEIVYSNQRPITHRVMHALNQVAFRP